ncbi:HTH-type transcriptional activator CmpR [Rhodoplanes serenus]|uniref:HTH-type transcriptional regulator CbbR n=1 Tax=Rhodoplanes serenus TaxID=200615 RepID=A0A3S4B412_9BRAD|nr:LysR family transcriptional regulator [Rhodoplanes serenus]VCU08589.1 HTH-type transcriptional activator CmpR [Rhodoplanes serenus]
MRNLTLKHLRLLESAARLGSFTAAAEANHITPPAVTMQMRQLEQEVGLPLFDRDARGLTPTAAGHELLLAARRIEGVLTECREALAALQDLGAGKVTVGVVSTAKYFAPRMLAAYARRFPAVELQLVVGNRRDIVAQFEAGQFDVCVMGRPPETCDVESERIGPHPHGVIAPPDHPLAGRAGLSPQAIAGETVLVREVGSGTRTLMESFFARAGIAPTIGMEIGSNETIKQAVMAGLGLAFISAHTIAAELADGRLVMLDIEGLPVERAWFVVRLASRRLMPAARSLRDFLVAEGGAFLPTLPPGTAPARAGTAALISV